MAEQNDAPSSESAAESADLQTRRVRRNAVRRAPARTLMRRERSGAVARRERTPGTPRRGMKPLRNIAILAAVAALIGGVALPAYGIFKPSAEALTLQQVAEDSAQSLTVSDEAATVELDRDSYSATTPEEIEKKKAQEAAAERARQLAASVAVGPVAPPVNLAMVAPGSGAIRWPLAPGTFNIGDGFLSRGGAHKGVDMIAAGGTPIYASAAGVVRVSQDNFGGYGNAITIDHVINGQVISTLYAHIMYGGRHVVSGQTVEAGQLIAQVGSTGRSTTNHLHFELFIGGQYADGLAWLQQNAG